MAGVHPWDEDSPLKICHSIAFKHQFITGRPPLGEILYPPLFPLMQTNPWASKAGGGGREDASPAVDKSPGDVPPETRTFQYLFRDTHHFWLHFPTFPK